MLRTYRILCSSLRLSTTNWNLGLRKIIQIPVMQQQGYPHYWMIHGYLLIAFYTIFARYLLKFTKSLFKCMIVLPCLTSIFVNLQFPLLISLLLASQISRLSLVYWTVYLLTNIYWSIWATCLRTNKNHYLVTFNQIDWIMFPS